MLCLAKNRGEIMALGYIESETQVEEFLNKVRSILCSNTFDINRDLDVLISPVVGSPGYKNFATLADLDYDITDVRNVILSTTVYDYSETMFDTKDVTTPLFRVFGKQLNNKEVYMKIKIRDNTSRQVFCISFHYAEDEMKKPYAIRKG